MEDISKLPKWAQQKIQALEMRIKHLEGLDSIRDTQRDMHSNELGAYINAGSQGAFFQPLEKYSHVQLVAGGVRAGLMWRGGEEIELTVSSASGLCGTVAIIPRVSNQVLLKVI